MFKKLNEQTISELNKLNPIYISLSDYFFKNLSKLSFIEYETIETISRIERKDLKSIIFKIVLFFITQKKGSDNMVSSRIRGIRIKIDRNITKLVKSLK